MVLRIGLRRAIQQAGKVALGNFQVSLGKALPHCGNCIAFGNGDFPLRDNFAGVNLIRSAKESYACFAFTVDYRPDRGGEAAVFRQQRIVKNKSALLRAV